MVKSHGLHCKFKKFLLVNNIKQKELAEKLSKSHSFTNKGLNGVSVNFTLDNFRTISAYLI